MDAARDKSEFRYVCLILLLGTLAVYGLTLRAGFVNFDDIDYVTKNSHVQRGLTTGGVAWAFTTGYAANWHPLTWISLMVDKQFYGLRPGGYHLTNLLFHAANSLLLLAVLKKMTGALWRSAFVAALFAWHPLHVESVAWVAERKDVLSAFFWLLTMWYYLQYVGEAKVKGALTRRFYGLTLLFFACGLLSKPMVVTLPFVLLLLDYWPLRRFSDLRFAIDDSKKEGVEYQATGSSGRILLEKIPFFALAFISSAVTFAVQKSGGAVALLERVPVKERIANALISYIRYLRKMFWPDDLAIFYPFQHHWAAWQWVGAGLLLALLSLVAVVLRKRRPYVAVGWFWYLGTLVPVIGLVQVGDQALADRYTYLPLIGVFIVIAWGVDELTQAWPRRGTILKMSAAMVLATCLVLTTVQAGYWQNSITLFTHAIAVTKDNTVAHANLGSAFDQQGRIQEAKDEFMKALQIDPDSPSTLNGLATLYAHGGDAGQAEIYFHSALRKHPFYSDAYYNLGNVLAGEGRYAEAAEQFAEAARLKPDSADAHNNLGAMYVRLGRLDKAVDEFKAALAVLPDFPEAHFQLGGVFHKLGHDDIARMHYAETVRLKPDFAAARVKLGLLLAREGELDAAVSQFLEANKLEPTNAATCYNLAAAYAEQKKLDLAADYFARAARLDPKDADTQGRLAGVLAVQGKSEAAINAYRETLRLKPDSPKALRDLAWLLATTPKAEIRNGEEAVRLAEHANALNPQPDPRFLEALDAAYAEAGRFDDAIRTAEKVQQLATAAQQKIVADRAAQRIALYKAGKPFHE